MNNRQLVIGERYRIGLHTEVPELDANVLILSEARMRRSCKFADQTGIMDEGGTPLPLQHPYGPGSQEASWMADITNAASALPAASTVQRSGRFGRRDWNAFLGTLADSIAYSVGWALETREGLDKWYDWLPTVRGLHFLEQARLLDMRVREQGLNTLDKKESGTFAAIRDEVITRWANLTLYKYVVHVVGKLTRYLRADLEDPNTAQYKCLQTLRRIGREVGDWMASALLSWRTDVSAGFRLFRLSLISFFLDHGVLRAVQSHFQRGCSATFMLRGRQMPLVATSERRVRRAEGLVRRHPDRSYRKPVRGYVGEDRSDGVGGVHDAGPCPRLLWLLSRFHSGHSTSTAA